MTRLINKKMRDSFICESQLENAGCEYALRYSRLYITEKQKLAVLKRIVK